MVLTSRSTQVGPRSASDKERFPPNNMLLVLAGAALLWLGWTGFNGGDPYSANIDSSTAVLNTHICASTSLLVWTLLDVFFFGKPSVIGAVQGMITGLVCITPGAAEKPSLPPLADGLVQPRDLYINLRLFSILIGQQRLTRRDIQQAWCKAGQLS